MLELPVNEDIFMNHNNDIVEANFSSKDINKVILTLYQRY